MGNMCGQGLTEEQKRNRMIEAEMRKDQTKDLSKIKLLLLGAGESGKSTLFKQMKILYSESKNFSSDERESYIGIIHSNIVADMKEMVKACPSHTPLENEDPAEKVMNSWQKDQKLGDEECQTLLTLWKDPGMIASWNNRGDIQVQDALEYYMKDIERVCSSGFSPTNSDILHSRVRTSGVVQETFHIGEATFEMYDVGGQRNERRKWIHSFEGVTSVMFVGAISEYNQVLFEDNHQSRQDEAVELFGKQLESEWFTNTPFILFLNKVDLFREKLATIPFRLDTETEKRNLDYSGPVCDPNKTYKYEGDDDKEFMEIYNATCDYLKWLYNSQGDSPTSKHKGDIYTHFTNSTDTENIEKIMASCKDIILNINLKEGGWFSDA